jgi:hypothetical protein
MKRVLWLLLSVLLVFIFGAVGCSKVTPDSTVSVVNQCLQCHTDEATLQELAVEEEDPEAEASSGEG